MKNAKITIGHYRAIANRSCFCEKRRKGTRSRFTIQNVEALATGESFPDGEIACFGDGSVDCPFTYLKLK